MITRLKIDRRYIKDNIIFKGSSEKDHIGNVIHYTSETQLANVTTVKKENWKHTTPDGITSGAKLRSIDIRGDVAELEILTRQNEEGYKIGSMMNHQVELVYFNDMLLGVVIVDK